MNININNYYPCSVSDHDPIRLEENYQGKKFGKVGWDRTYLTQLEAETEKDCKTLMTQSVSALKDAGLENLIPYLNFDCAKVRATKVQEQILSFLAFRDNEAHTATQIADRTGLCTDTVASHCKILRQQGKVSAFRILEDTKIRYFIET